MSASKRYCHDNRHMTGMEFAVYTLCRRLAYKKDSGDGVLKKSGRSIAKLFGKMDKDTVYRALESLREKGWLKRLRHKKMIKEDTSAPTFYRVILHDEWAAKQPAGCCPATEESEDEYSDLEDLEEDEAASTGIDPALDMGTGPACYGDTPVGTVGTDLSPTGSHVLKEVKSYRKAEKTAAVALAQDRSCSKNTASPYVPTTGTMPTMGTVPTTGTLTLDGHHSKLSALTEMLQARLVDLKSIVKLEECSSEGLNDLGISALDAFPMDDLMSAWSWAVAAEDPFWTKRGLLSKNATRNLLQNFTTIAGQMGQAAHRKAKGKKIVHKARSVVRNPAKPLQSAMVQE